MKNSKNEQASLDLPAATKNIIYPKMIQKTSNRETSYHIVQMTITGTMQKMKNRDQKVPPLRLSDMIATSPAVIPYYWE